MNLEVKRKQDELGVMAGWMVLPFSRRTREVLVEGGGENAYNESSFKHTALEMPRGGVWVNHGSSAQKPGLV